MNVLALILALIAIVIFVATHFRVPRKWATLALGLAFLASAWVVQLVWVTHQWTHR